jgi:maleate isomerase
MAFSSWRGVVGMVFPTLRPGTLDELVRLLPPGIALLPLFNNIHLGTKDELLSMLDQYERKLGELAEVGVDLLCPSGAPPFIARGYRDSREIVRRWEEKFGVPIFTTAQNDCEALLALGVKRVLGVTYLSDEFNALCARYLRDAGFDCLGVTGIGVAFDKMQELASTEVYRFVQQTFLAHPDADGIYLLGAWRVLDIIERMEQDFGVPIVLGNAAQSWGIQHRLQVREPRPNVGRLLGELPAYRPLSA